MKLPILVLFTLALAISAVAQSTDTKQSTAKTANAKSDGAVDAEAEVKERRARARSLLISLSSDARTFHNQTLRARSLARIADALWQVDADQARLLFRKAWEAAESADIESEKKLQEEIRLQRERTGGYAIHLPSSIRREVLRLAARRDRALGEELLEKLKTQKLEAANSTPIEPPNPNRLSDALSQRLGVATELLRTGEIERAIQFAEAALNVVSRESVQFLAYLRERDANAADRFFAGMLTSAANNPQSDANTASLLSSYIFTPHLYITFSGNDTSTSQNAESSTPPVVAPELRRAFFQTAAAILLRPLPPPGQDQTVADLNAKYLVIKRFLPFFEQSAPAGMVESLRGHLNALNAAVSDETRRRDDEWLNKGIKPDKPAEEREQALLDQIDRAKTSAERDVLYIRLAFFLAEKGEMRARDFVSKVEDSELRNQAQAYIDPSLAMHFVRKKQADQALELVHKGELTHLQKAWVLTGCAKLVATTDQQKALELIDQAAVEARRIEVSDPSLPRALVAIANALKEIEPSRVWDATFDAVKAANSAEGFSGEDGLMVLTFQSKGSSSLRTSSVAEFDLDGIFRDLATQDYDRAVELARGFQGEGPRAVATIAIARAVLEPKKSDR